MLKVLSDFIPLRSSSSTYIPHLSIIFPVNHKNCLFRPLPKLVPLFSFHWLFDIRYFGKFLNLVPPVNYVRSANTINIQVKQSIASKKIYCQGHFQASLYYCNRFCQHEKLNQYLTHFSSMFHFYTPWQCQKTLGFLMFSGGIEMEQWAEIC